MSDAASRAAALLLAARRDRTKLLDHLPPELRPADRAAAYAIQHRIAGSLGAIGGWKVSPAQPDGPPVCGPLPAAGLFAAPATLPAGFSRLRGIEAEVAVRIGHDLPPRATPWSHAEVAAAIASFHPAIELLDSRFVEPGALDLMTLVADSQSHAGFVHGPPVTAWRAIDLAAEACEQFVDDRPDAAHTGHPGGDLLGQVVWLANEGSLWAGGLKAGQFVTCGSWTGAHRVRPGARVRVRFATLGEAAVTFGT
jgi:2-keto-4-pentenoate hydratase